MSFKDLFTSSGLKRALAAALAAILEIVRLIPGAEGAVVVLEWIAGLLGGVGVTHAAAKGTLGYVKIAGVSSFLSALILALTFVPGMEPLVPYLKRLASLLGAIGLGTAIGKPEVFKEVKMAEERKSVE